MQRHRLIIAILLSLIAIYIVQVLVVTPDTSTLSKYSLSTTSARMLSVTVLVPLIAVWCAAIYGYIRLSNYAASIRKTVDGTALKSLSYGILALALWLPINAVMQNAASDIWHAYPATKEGVIITTNLLNVVMLLTVSYLLLAGSRSLLRAADIDSFSIGRKYVYAVTATFGLVFSYAVLCNPNKNLPGPNGVAAFYLPDVLLVLLIIIPYVAVCYMSLSAVQNIHTYRNRVKGIIYKGALRYVANGIGSAMIAALTMRTLAANSGWFEDMGLRLLLLVVYALVFMIGVGYILLVLGARKLQLIEEV